jgi:predicted P-loop ATPase
VCSAILLKPVAPDPAKFVARPVTDIDITHLQERLQVWFPSLSKDTTCQALDAVAHERAFHPIRDWLGGLQWDGKRRVATWLSTYLRVKRSEYADKVGEMFLLAMIARVMAPGCKADNLLILEGMQGVKKSTACEVLAGQWFSDSLPDLEKARDCAQHLAGKWLCEIPEMMAVKRADVERFKAFSSRRIERYRRPYDRKEVHEPRQAVFVATTNRLDGYLRDESGNRRVWPVRVGEIDIDALKVDREQLFAEALVLYRAGARWWPDADFEKTHIVPEQDDRYESDDVWEGDIAAYLEGKAEIDIKEVAINVLGFESMRQVSAKEVWDIKKILRHLRWTTGRRLAYRRTWVPLKD